MFVLYKMFILFKSGILVLLNLVPWHPPVMRTIAGFTVDNGPVTLLDIDQWAIVLYPKIK